MVGDNVLQVQVEEYPIFGVLVHKVGHLPFDELLARDVPKLLEWQLLYRDQGQSGRRGNPVVHVGLRPGFDQFRAPVIVVSVCNQEI